jgi:hypothetical protein
MQNYGNDFDFFDLANETTVNNRFDNPVSRWVERISPINMMKFAAKLVGKTQLDYPDNSC